MSDLLGLIQKMRESAVLGKSSGATGQMLGCESYRLTVTGNSLAYLEELAESQAKRIAEMEAITKIECDLHDCLVMPREDDQGPLFYQPANSTLVLAKLRDYAIIPKAKYHELEAEVAALRGDAGRLDWLEDCAKCYWVTIQTQPGGSYCRSGQGVGVREAIDAAIKEQQ